MALFLILALRESAPAVEAAISEKFTSENFYQIESGKWIVDAEALTAKDVSEVKLTLPNTVWHIIVAIKGYYGSAQHDMWEWLAAQANKLNAYKAVVGPLGRIECSDEDVLWIAEKRAELEAAIESLKHR